MELHRCIEHQVHLDCLRQQLQAIQLEHLEQLKMTYECYNAVERFTGERLVNGKWEFNFSMLDLGVTPDRSNYVCDSSKRLARAESLIEKGIKFFNILNQ